MLGLITGCVIAVPGIVAGRVKGMVAGLVLVAG